jgi:hypothetical protein
MSGAASVKIKEIDLSTRVASFEGVFGAMVIPATKGPVDPQLMSSDTQLLNTFTPDGTVEAKFDLSYFSALAYLERANKLWVKRVNNGGTFSALSLTDVLGVASSFNAAVAGVTVNVELLADNVGTVGDAILVTGDNVITLTVLLNDWNVANPANTATLLSANGADVPALAAPMQLAGGVDGGANAAVPGGSNIVDPTAYVFGANEALLIHAANVGVWGDDVAVKVTNIGDDPDLIEPNSFLIEVFKSANTVVPLESFLVSRTLGQKDGRGLNMYVEDVLKGSNYIRAISNPAIDEDVYPISQVTALFMGDGDDGIAITDSNMVNAVNDFSNPNDKSVTLIMDGGFTVPAYQIAIDTICQTRQDCVGIFSVPFSDEASATYLNDIVEYRKDELNLNSSYSALYTPHLEIQDRFNDRTIWAAPDGHVGGSVSFASEAFEIWYPAAGFTRGILNVLDTRQRFSDGEMDQLYNNQINPIRFISGSGIVVWGQKTLLSRASALDRLNVRLLLIVIEPAIKKLLENFLFDLNDAGSRLIAETKIESYLEGIKAKRGVTDFDVVSDTSNNSQDDLDNNRMNVDIFIKPTGSIEDIPVRVVIVPNSISFSQAAGAI